MIPTICLRTSWDQYYHGSQYHGSHHGSQYHHVSLIKIPTEKYFINTHEIKTDPENENNCPMGTEFLLAVMKSFETR